MDLLAVLAADKRTKGEPRQVPRPDHLGRAGGRQPAPAGPSRQDDGFKQAINVLRATSRSTYVTNVPVAAGRV